jgi:hypothetical protein|tara:strand:- start:2009 stop:2416 length:408 start_codon:yes stop_codon:yes gene_type:complete
MATTTATLTLNSADLTGDALALSSTATLTQAGNTTGLDQTTGVARKTFATAQTATNLLAAADYTDDLAHKVYIKNISTNAAEYITIEFDGPTDVLNMGRLYANDWAFFPWDGTTDIDIDTSATNMTVEFAVIYQV